MSRQKITTEQYLRYATGQLATDEAEKFEALVASDPALNKQMHLYKGAMFNLGEADKVEAPPIRIQSSRLANKKKSFSLSDLYSGSFVFRAGLAGVALAALVIWSPWAVPVTGESYFADASGETQQFEDGENYSFKKITRIQYNEHIQAVTGAGSSFTFDGPNAITVNSGELWLKKTPDTQAMTVKFRDLYQITLTGTQVYAQIKPKTDKLHLEVTKGKVKLKSLKSVEPKEQLLTSGEALLLKQKNGTMISKPIAQNPANQAVFDTLKGSPQKDATAKINEIKDEVRQASKQNKKLLKKASKSKKKNEPNKKAKLFLWDGSILEGKIKKMKDGSFKYKGPGGTKIIPKKKIKKVLYL